MVCNDVGFLLTVDQGIHGSGTGVCWVGWHSLTNVLKHLNSTLSRCVLHAGLDARLNVTDDSLHQVSDRSL